MKRFSGTHALTWLCGPQRLEAMASLIDRYNASHRGAVVTIEQPLTVLHRDAMAAISQREVGIDIPSIAAGIDSARRQRPDLIAVTEIPDAAAAESVLRAAEDQLQIIACVSAPTTDLAPEWLLRNFHTSEQVTHSNRLSRVLTNTLYARA